MADHYILVVDTEGADECDPGFDRYSIGVSAHQMHLTGRGNHPLIHFGNGHDHAVIPKAGSVKELKAMLRSMLKACDQKPFRLVAGDIRLVLCDE